MKITIALAVALAGAAHAAAAGPKTYADAEIAGILSVANQGELDAAALAKDKAEDSGVKAFAEQMTKEHSDAKAKLETVEEKAALEAADSDLSAELKRAGSDEVTRLDGLGSAEFDRAYVSAQIADHDGLLKVIDRSLIPQAKNGDLAALLRKLRPVVAHHLAMARKLQGQLAGRGK